MTDQAAGISAKLRTMRLMFFMAGIGISVWAITIPFTKIRFHLNDGTLGLMLLAGGTGGMLAMPFGGMAIGRWGSRAVLHHRRDQPRPAPAAAHPRPQPARLHAAAAALRRAVRRAGHLPQRPGRGHRAPAAAGCKCPAFTPATASARSPSPPPAAFCCISASPTSSAPCSRLWHLPHPHPRRLPRPPRRGRAPRRTDDRAAQPRHRRARPVLLCLLHDRRGARPIGARSICASPAACRSPAPRWAIPPSPFP